MTTRSIYGLDPSKYPSNMGKAWKEDEVIKLLTSIQKKKSIAEIAAEHGRTVGGITSHIQKLAVDYYFNDNRPIEEIQKYTGLTKDEIEFVIKRHEAKERTKEAIKASTRGKSIVEVINTPTETVDDEIATLKEDVKELKADMKEILRLLNILYEYQVE